MALPRYPLPLFCDFCFVNALIFFIFNASIVYVISDLMSWNAQVRWELREVMYVTLDFISKVSCRPIARADRKKKKKKKIYFM